MKAKAKAKAKAKTKAKTKAKAKAIRMYSGELLKSKVKNFLKRMIKGESLPCFVISKEPLILISYWQDFIDHLPELKQRLKGERFFVFFQLGWHVETLERTEEVKEAFTQLDQSNFNFDYCFLANSLQEEKTLKEVGYKASFCHQNAFLDESFYKVHSETSREYDAVYLARITPFKRHDLARKVKSLLLIGDYKESESHYFTEVQHSLKHGFWRRKVWASSVYKYLNKAYVGLCLSAEEGAMFVSAEYLLCGIPIVSTKSLGGRDQLFDSFSCLIVEDNPEAVAAGVQQQKFAKLDPQKIRASVIDKMQNHRQKFIELVQEVYDKSECKRQFKNEFEALYYHKFGLRSSPPKKIVNSRMLK